MKNLIIDSNNLLYRIFHINKSVNGNSLVMFFRTLRHYVEKFEPDNIFAVWDKKLIHPSTNFRKELTKTEYKANRDYSELEEIHKDDKVIAEMITSLGIKTLYPRILEGDDVIAWLAHTLPGETIIVSVDQDFCQLVNQNVHIFSPIKKVLITESNLEEHTKVRPDCFLRFKSICGDMSDNIQGLDGFGKVKSKKLAENWNEHSYKLTEEQLKTVEMNMQIVNLSYGYTVYPEETESYRQQLKDQELLQPDFTKFKEICKSNNLTEITEFFIDWTRPFKGKETNEGMVSCVNSIVNKLKLQYS